MESLERKKIKAEDLADLANKSDEELREIIEKLRFTNRDLNDQVNEGKGSHEKREKELEQQILGLNNMIKNLRSSHDRKQSSVRNLGALAALSASNSSSSRLSGGFVVPSPKNVGKVGGIGASLASKLPFGKKKNVPTIQNKNDKIASCLVSDTYFVCCVSE